VRSSVVRVVNERSGGRYSVGSAYAVASGDLLITNEHVVNGAVGLSVVLVDGRQLPARVLRADEGRDLALLHVPGVTLTPVRFSQGPAPAPGQPVLAVGFPQSAAPTLEPTLTSGRITMNVVSNGATFYQTNVPAGVGNSGGPLLTPCGEVIGTVSSGTPQSGGVTFGIGRQEVEAFLAGAPPLTPGGSMPRTAPTPASATAVTRTPAAAPALPSVPTLVPPRTAIPTRRATAVPRPSDGG
jgi:S1-C subfamily serine protease